MGLRAGVSIGENIRFVFERIRYATPYFRRLRELTLRLSRQSTGTVSLKEPSMGMPNDYHVAIEEGATMVWVGTAIVGAQHV